MQCETHQNINFSALPSESHLYLLYNVSHASSFYNYLVELFFLLY